MADENNHFKYHNDEPIAQDTLDRDKYATAFANMVTKCQTPLVVGLYGSWGVGKTSLMKLTEAKISDRDARKVWFDPWQHQFNDDPLLAMVQTLYDSLETKTKKRSKA